MKKCAIWIMVFYGSVYLWYTGHVHICGTLCHQKVRWQQSRH